MSAAVFIAAVFISTVSQVLLKKSAEKKYLSRLDEYLNPLVIIAYCMFFLSTIMAVFAYRGLPLSIGAVLDTLGYIFITVFGLIFFGEKPTKRKIAALMLIVSGSVIYTFG